MMWFTKVAKHHLREMGEALRDETIDSFCSPKVARVAQTPLKGLGGEALRDEKLSIVFWADYVIIFKLPRNYR
jgi:hypothetical protein